MSARYAVKSAPRLIRALFEDVERMFAIAFARLLRVTNMPRYAIRYADIYAYAISSLFATLHAAMMMMP